MENNNTKVNATLEKIFRKRKGILAIDERDDTLNKRFKKYNIPISPETRKNYRDMLFNTKSLSRYISGVILTENTFTNHTIDNKSLSQYLTEKGIEIGVKVDEGLIPYKNSKILKLTNGKNSLIEKCVHYKMAGVNFLKWRAVVPVSSEVDTEFLETLTNDLIFYADIALKNDMVPIIEPEILAEGDHSLQEQKEIMAKTLLTLSKGLYNKGVNIKHCILKTSFVMGGLNTKNDADEVAKNTVEVLNKYVKNFGGIVFLSGGLTAEQASNFLEKTYELYHINKDDGNSKLNMTFSYGRALQEEAWDRWNGENETVDYAQKGLIRLIRQNCEVLK